MMSLCQNDKNKTALVNAGVAPLLVRLIKYERVKDYTSGGSPPPPEQRERAARVVWLLSFIKDNYKALIDAKVIPALEALRDCTDPKLSSTRSTKAANGALFQLGHNGNGEDEAATAKTGMDGHIMLSYNWFSQKLVVKIKDALEAAGYKVWIDLNEMKGSTLEAMAKAVEQCSVFCMVISRRYKESVNCRAEAEYAFQLHKPIVPLMAEQGYKADGWLGALLGSKLWYDFTQAITLGDAGEMSVDVDRVPLLTASMLKELQQHAHARAGSDEKHAAQSDVNDNTPAYLKWNTDQVVEWVIRVGFPLQSKYFRSEKFSGVGLSALRKLQGRDVACQLSCLEKLHFKLGEALAFSEVLQAGPMPPPSK